MSVPPLLFALACWFFGTAVVVWLDSRPRPTWKWSLALGGLASAIALWVIGARAGDSSTAGVYSSFAAAIVIWGWHEMAFLMGHVAGPRRTPCPANLHGWARFRAASETVIHHEIALAATLALLATLSWGGVNPFGALAFGLLFVMRLSAKLNLYLGVANLSDEVFPEHLAYLKSYFGQARWNALYPWSLALGAGLTLAAWQAAEAARAPGIAAGYTLIAGLAFLGLVEHLLLMLPVRDAALWAWANQTKAAKAAVQERRNP